MKITKKLIKQLIKEEIQTEMERPIGDPNRPGANPKKSQEIYRKLKADAMNLSRLLQRSGLSIRNLDSLLADIMGSDGVEPLRNAEGRRAYIRENKKPAKYDITTIQCRPGASGISRDVETRKGRKLIELCPGDSDLQAQADMGVHKNGIEQALLKIAESPEAFEALAYLESIKHPSRDHYEPLLGHNPRRIIENYLRMADPFGPNRGIFQTKVLTKENYNKRFDSVMYRIYESFDPLKNMDAKLKKDTDMQRKLGVLYDYALKFFKHIKEYHKARIAQ